MKRITALLIVLAVIISALCGCSATGGDTSGGNADDDNSGSAKGLTLLYCATDSLNPYQAKTDLNRKLCTLLYDPLVKLDDEFAAHYVLASSVTVTGKTCVVELCDAVFSDGSRVMNDDVVYSYNLAKKAEDQIYSAELYEVTSCSCGDNNSVIFKLTKSDPYFENLLSFPVFKANSEKRTDEDMIVLPPIGSGMYTIDTSALLLNANPSYIGQSPKIKTINLINAPDKEIVNYNLEADNISIYGTDLYDGIIPSMPGNYIKYNLNSLVFIGANCTRGVMRNTALRYAVSDIADRESICESCFYSYATPAKGLFNSAWKDTAGSQNIQSTAITQNLVAYFKELGYNSKDDDGFYQNSVGTTINLRLICNSENTNHKLTAENVAKRLNDAGLKTYVKALSRSDYMYDLQNGNFDLYIGEVKLLNNMDVSSIVTSSGKLAYGLKSGGGKEDDTSSGTASAKTGDKTDGKTANKASENTSSDKTEPKDPGSAEDGKENVSAKTIDDSLNNAVKGFYDEKLSLIDIVNAFNAEMPIIPLCHRQGITVCATYLSVNDISSSNDVYFGMENVEMK